MSVRAWRKLRLNRLDSGKRMACEHEWRYTHVNTQWTHDSDDDVDDDGDGNGCFFPQDPIAKSKSKKLSCGGKGVSECEWVGVGVNLCMSESEYECVWV